MILIVGLGNPGKDYADTRHNLGFMVVDGIAKKLGSVFAKSNKFHSELATGDQLLLAKPLTYMNLSGQPVQAISSYYKIERHNIVIIHDDIDLVLGDVRIKCGGSHAGHNGLKSIDGSIGQEYWRIRCGIGRPSNNIEVSDYVLSNLTKSELVEVEFMISHILYNLDLLTAGKFEELKTITR